METLTVAEHARLDSITFILENRTSLKFASAEQNWNTVLSFNHSRSKLEASHTTVVPGKHQRFAVLNFFLPSNAAAFSHQARPRQLLRTPSRGGQELLLQE